MNSTQKQRAQLLQVHSNVRESQLRFKFTFKGTSHADHQCLESPQSFQLGFGRCLLSSSTTTTLSLRYFYTNLASPSSSTIQVQQHRNTMLPFRFRRHFFGVNDPPDSENSESAASSTRKPQANLEDHTFYPSLWDVLKVRYMLQWKAFKASLPVELVDAIVDAAEYWPSTEREMEGGKRIISTDRDQVLLKTVPLCYDRKVCTFHFELRAVLSASR